ncbi:MAG: LapA family protein [Chloroflexi bacterium]|nr:LapA family protein [Chloroflexota bacterium]
MVTEQAPDSPGPSRRTLARLIGGAVVVLLFLVFVLQNRGSTRIHFLFWEGTFGLAWALIIAGVLGIIIGLVVPRLRRFL